jgi:hypothetical protein
MGTLQTELAKIKPPHLDGSEQAVEPGPKNLILGYECATTGKIEYQCAVTGKIRFLSRRAAQRHADTLNNKAYAYLCRFCSGFHFSRKNWRQTRGSKVRRGRQAVWFSDGAKISAKEYEDRVKKMEKADLAKAKRRRAARKSKVQPKRKLGKKKKRPVVRVRR